MTAVETIALAMQGRWRCGGSCDVIYFATAYSSQGDSGGDAAAAATPLATQLPMAVETAAVVMRRRR